MKSVYYENRKNGIYLKYISSNYINQMDLNIQKYLYQYT